MSTTSTAGFRVLTESEREIVERLLEPEFPGRDALRVQVTQALVRPTDGDGCVEFSAVTAPRAAVRFNVPTEGEYQGLDGITLHVQLHVVDGRLRSLEFYKADGSIPKGLPPARDLKVYAAYSVEAGAWNRADKVR